MTVKIPLAGAPHRRGPLHLLADALCQKEFMGLRPVQGAFIVALAGLGKLPPRPPPLVQKPENRRLPPGLRCPVQEPILMFRFTRPHPPRPKGPRNPCWARRRSAPAAATSSPGPGLWRGHDPRPPPAPVPPVARPAHAAGEEPTQPDETPTSPAPTFADAANGSSTTIILQASATPT